MMNTNLMCILHLHLLPNPHLPTLLQLHPALDFLPIPLKLFLLQHLQPYIIYLLHHLSPALRDRTTMVDR
ncbi:hypothetical protein KSP39_PZI016235 [Platanthera zijinensis]|uniref:Uncharacterized protein n=1 Tax=Platanthera zijinensis TaxID=2320716 RepID=A0AAP0G0F2_9ASPA